jgi:hypothetical protein
MRLPRVRLTVQRLMVVVLIVGVTIGATVELDRALTRRAAYLELAYEADWRGVAARSSATRLSDQGEALRKWVANGATGVLPGELSGMTPLTHSAYIMDRKEAEGLRRDPEKALALANDCDQRAERELRVAEERAGQKRSFERAATFPRVFVAPDPPEPRP